MIKKRKQRLIPVLLQNLWDLCPESLFTMYVPKISILVRRDTRSNVLKFKKIPDLCKITPIQQPRAFNPILLKLFCVYPPDDNASLRRIIAKTTLRISLTSPNATENYIKRKWWMVELLSVRQFPPLYFNTEENTKALKINSKLLPIKVSKRARLDFDKYNHRIIGGFKKKIVYK